MVAKAITRPPLGAGSGAAIWTSRCTGAAGATMRVRGTAWAIRRGVGVALAAFGAGAAGCAACAGADCAGRACTAGTGCATGVVAALPVWAGVSSPAIAGRQMPPKRADVIRTIPRRCLHVMAFHLLSFVLLSVLSYVYLKLFPARATREYCAGQYARMASVGEAFVV